MLVLVFYAFVARFVAFGMGMGMIVFRFPLFMFMRMDDDFPGAPAFDAYLCTDFSYSLAFRTFFRHG